MTFDIKYQEVYSRGELLLRSFFGFIYIAIPHFFMMFLYGILAQIYTFLAFWMILFTGRYPESWWEYNLNFLRYQMRVNARLFNLADGFPPFGLGSEDDAVTLEVPYPQTLGRGTLLLKAFLGFIYVIIPHGFVLMFRLLWGNILGLIAWFVVLFTGRYPQSSHEFNTGTYRWIVRLNLYLGLMSDDYPPFSGKP